MEIKSQDSKISTYPEIIHNKMGINYLGIKDLFNNQIKMKENYRPTF